MKTIDADGWTLVLPDPETPVTHVHAEARTRAEADASGSSGRRPTIEWILDRRRILTPVRPGPGTRPGRVRYDPRQRRSSPPATQRSHERWTSLRILRYTSDHEWARLEDGMVRVGLTDFAQDALGDVVFVQLPPSATPSAKGGELGEVESTKSVSQVYAPVGGTVVEVNVGTWPTQPERINTDAYGEGWLCVIEPSDPRELDELLDAAGYRTFTEA